MKELSEEDFQKASIDLDGNDLVSLTEKTGIYDWAYIENLLKRKGWK